MKSFILTRALNEGYPKDPFPEECTIKEKDTSAFETLIRTGDHRTVKVDVKSYANAKVIGDG